MYKITYIERNFLDRFRCIDHIKNTFVIDKGFKNGGLTYFKKDRFNFLVLDTNFILNVAEA